MYRTVYILGDLPIEFNEDEYFNTFTKEQIEDLEAGLETEWVDEEGIDHIIKLC